MTTPIENAPHEAATPLPAAPPAAPAEEHGPAPVGTLFVVAVLLLVTIAFWCLVLGIQQGRA